MYYIIIFYCFSITSLIHTRSGHRTALTSTYKLMAALHRAGSRLAAVAASKTTILSHFRPSMRTQLLPTTSNVQSRQWFASRVPKAPPSIDTSSSSAAGKMKKPDGFNSSSLKAQQLEAADSDKILAEEFGFMRNCRFASIDELERHFRDFLRRQIYLEPEVHRELKKRGLDVRMQFNKGQNFTFESRQQLFSALEDEYGIDIPDSAVEYISTAWDLLDHIALRLGMDKLSGRESEGGEKREWNEEEEVEEETEWDEEMRRIEEEQQTQRKRKRGNDGKTGPHLAPTRRREVN